MMATPGAPRKRKRGTKSRVYRKRSKPYTGRKYAKKLVSLRKKRRGRSGSSSLGDRYQGSVSTKRKYPGYLRKTLSRLDQQTSRAQWTAFDRISCNSGYQGYNSWACGFGGVFPGTTDPGNGMVADLRKIWFEYTGTAAGNQTRGIILDKISQELEFNCCGDNTCTLTLYTFIARRDHSNEPHDLWNAGLTNNVIKSVGPTGTTGINASMVGTTPYQSTQFCQSFKVIGTKNVTLQPGRTYKLKNNYSIKKRFDAKLFENGEKFKKGITHGVMIVIRGAMVNEFGQATASEVMNGPAACLVSIKTTVHFKVDNTENRDTYMQFYNMANPTGLLQPANYNPTTGAMDTTVTNGV